MLQILAPATTVRDWKWVAGGIKAELESLARSLLMKRQVPVAIVADGDSFDPSVVAQRQWEIESFVAKVAIEAPVKVLLFTPSLEILFFQDLAFLASLLDLEISPEDWARGQQQPKAVLNTLLARSPHQLRSPHADPWQTLLDRLAAQPPQALTPLQQHPVIQALHQFLTQVEQWQKSQTIPEVALK
ncbi:MAG: hypothetical protein ACO331_09690 [Prochlorothrix sp.]